ncbi:hypothetical protein ACFE04_014240 [Oxalis oulophora]
MEDVLTENPPPSRFLLEDLNIFTPPSPPLPTPLLLLNTTHSTLHPKLLIITISSPSLYIFHHFSSKSLIGNLILPEIPFSGNSVDPTLGDKSCNIYSFDDSTLIVSLQYPISAERSHAVAKLLIGGDRIIPDRVLILDTVNRLNFRGTLSTDDAYAFKLETSLERQLERSSLMNELPYFPSGSLVDGLSAALLSRCQMAKIKGTLCLSWPEFDESVVSLLKSLLLKNVLPGIDLSFKNVKEDDFSRFKDHPSESDLYT